MGREKFSEQNSVKSPEHKRRREGEDLSPCVLLTHRRGHVGTTVFSGATFQPSAETTVSDDLTEEETPRGDLKKGNGGETVRQIGELPPFLCGRVDRGDIRPGGIVFPRYQREITFHSAL